MLVLRIVRLLRVFRILKLPEYLEEAGYLTRDGCLPTEITDKAREEVAEYAGVTVTAGHVSAIEGSEPPKGDI